jgi:uncharacterized membrane protein YeaQ/YmgE (transglycosylase-associated protein family)
MRATDPAVILIVNLVVGALAGVAFDRLAGSSWLKRQFAGPAHGLVTSALIGIAGAFIGFHLIGLFGAGRTFLVLIASAAVGAVLVLWLWRMAR